MRQRTQPRKWAYLFTELLIVTLGVLFALALDQWFSSQRERKEEEIHLRAVRSEFQQIVNNLEQEIAFTKAVSASANRILALSGTGSNLEPKEFDALVNDSFFFLSEIYVPIGAVESIMASGKLRIIENEEIRFFLAGPPEWLKDIKETERDDYRLMMDQVMPFINDNANLVQLANAISGSPGKRGDKFLFSYPVGEIHDHSLLLRDTRFLNLVIQKAFRQDNMAAAYEGLRPELVRMIGLLDAELGD